LIGFDRAAQCAARAYDLLLTHELVESARSHSSGERLAHTFAAALTRIE